MKKIIIIVPLLLLSFVGSAFAQVSLGLSVNEGGNSFFLSVGDYFGVPQKEVVYVRERHIPDDEIPVVFFLAKRARVAPSAIIDMRLRGMPWMDISLHYGLGPDIFYFPVKETVVLGPPYGKAYGYFKKPRKEWKHIRFADDDVINLVNLRFISEHHHYAPEKVIVMRGEGRNFVYIDNDIRKGKKPHHIKGKDARREWKEERREARHEKREKHKGKGRRDD